MITANEALNQLKEGNRRFVDGTHSYQNESVQQQRKTLVDGQAPFAIILGCSDSRAPAELVFDQGLGDLFVIRVAGNIVAPSQIGSVEFAAEHFGTPLVVVMGHSHCGAVKATIDTLKQPTTNITSNIHSIVKRIRPAVEPLFDTDLRDRPEQLLQSAIRANVRAAKNHLSNGSTVLEQLIGDKKLSVVGAEYSLESGAVDFFDVAPEFNS